MKSIKNHYWIFICLTFFLFLLAGETKTFLPKPAASPEVTATLTNTPKPFIRQTGTPTLTATPTPPPILVETSRLNGTQIELWHSWTGEQRKALEELAVSFNQSNSWGIKLNTVQAGDGQTLFAELGSLLRDSSAEKIPHIIAASPEQIASINDQTGIVKSLAPYMGDPNFGLSNEEITSIPDLFWNQERGSVGKTTGLPALRTIHLLVYNQSWAKELGYDQIPSDPGEFRRQVCSAASAVTAGGDKEKAGTGGWIVNTEPETMLSWMVSFGFTELPIRSSQSYVFSTLNNQSMMVFLNNLWDSDCTWISKTTNPYDYFAQRQALVYSGELQDIPVQTKVMKRHGSNDQWTVIPYPGGQENQKIISSGYSYAVLDHGDVPNLAAWLAARWLNQPENQAKLGQASGMLPASQTAIGLMTDYQSQYPQWKDALSWKEKMLAVPGIGTWQTARLVVGDAGWQIFHPKPTPDSPSMVLDLLDRTISDAIEHRP